MKRIFHLDFLINGLERRIGYDLNGDGYIGGEGKTNVQEDRTRHRGVFLGLMSKLERFTHIDFNGDNVIGRPPDVYYPYPSMYGGPIGYPSMGFAAYPPYRYF